MPPLAIARYLSRDRVDLVALTLTDSAGQRLSENLYWPSRDEDGMRALNSLKPQPVRISGQLSSAENERVIRLIVEDTGTAPALNVKLTLVDQAGQRILPAFYSDNYISLLPGEPREIQIHYAAAHAGPVHLRLRGWNVQMSETSFQ